VTGGPAPDLPQEAFAAALAALPSMGPARLRRLLGAHSPAVAWERTAPDAGASRRDVERAWRRHVSLGIRVLVTGQASYPARLLDDPQAPAVLFCLGDSSALADVPTVALVGTRAPTRYGIGVAAQFGADLAAAGVSVVSGLALGIDGAAHEGACGTGAPPIAVVAGGLDHIYPRRHERLWERVVSTGVVVSESPAGVPTEKWRFPVRNRLLAALSDVVVVVESRHHGGSRHTVDAAMERGIPVGAVPGSIRSATSEGTNALLADGAFPVCSTGDILVALSLLGAAVSVPAEGRRPEKAALSSPPAPAPAPAPGRDRRVYDALSPDPTPLDVLARVTGLDLAELCGGLERLAQGGLARDAGGWWQRV
jgi:DNA processing protein